MKFILVLVLLVAFVSAETEKNATDHKVADVVAHTPIIKPESNEK